MKIMNFSYALQKAKTLQGHLLSLDCKEIENLRICFTDDDGIQGIHLTDGVVSQFVCDNDPTDKNGVLYMTKAEIDNLFSRIQIKP